MGQLTLGETVIYPVSEIEYCKIDVSFLFNDLTKGDMDRNLSWLGSDAIDVENNQLGFSFRAYLVKIGSHNILVDACNGNHKNRPTAKWQHNFDRPDFLNALRASGVAPEDVSCVICTHLHCDHVGWLTQLDDKQQWKPTFPNAKHLFSKVEYDYFHERLSRMESTAVNHGSFEDSIMPVIDSGNFELIEPDSTIVDIPEGTVRIVSSAGHSIGHISVIVESNDEKAIICGDAVHHPVQLDMPRMAMRSDFDVLQAQKSRIELLDFCADNDAWLLAGHFCAHPYVKIDKYGDVYRIRADNYQQVGK